MLFRNHIQLKINFKLSRILLATWLTFSMTGCDFSPSIVHYEDEILGVTLDYPGNWDLKIDERVDNYFVLDATQGLIVKNSARMEMWVNTYRCSSFNIDEHFNSRIDTILNEYELDDKSVILPPAEIDDWEYEAYQSSISIPTISLPDESSKNQMHDRDVNVFQLLAIYVIRNTDDCYVQVDVYSGKSDELNAQALEIVEGIRFIGPSSP